MTESSSFEKPKVNLDASKINFTSNLFFYLGLCLLLTHEMDAIRLQEWKMFLFLSQMQE